MKTIGLIGGLTWLSTIEYYRLLNQKVSLRPGGLHSAKLLMYSVEFADVSKLQKDGRWDELTVMFVQVAKNLQTAGAECLMIGANTMHKIADKIQSARLQFLVALQKSC